MHLHEARGESVNEPRSKTLLGRVTINRLTLQTPPLKEDLSLYSGKTHTFGGVTFSSTGVRPREIPSLSRSMLHSHH